MTDLVLCLISNWYDPEEQKAREERTHLAAAAATDVRQKVLVTSDRVVAVRQSYEQSERRAFPRSSKK